jgi:dihydroorotate dehydrogenase (fumarate)
MVDLTTTYMGLNLKNPLVASASPLSEKVDTVRQLEEAGVAAVVMYSLFEEEIINESLELDHYLEYGTDAFAEALTYLPESGRYRLGTEAYLKHVSALKEAVDIPIIGSLNGVSRGRWIEFAQKIQEAGADALELNIYYLPTDPDLSANELEDTYIDLVRNVREGIKIPLAVKLSPFFSSVPNIAKRIAEIGANGLVLFNRFYQPDFDLDTLSVIPNLVLSNSHELRLPLRWIAMLYGRVEIDLALTSGVHSHEDVLKAMMAGASVTMLASTLLRNGVGHLAEILNGLESWLEEREYESVTQMKGSMSQRAVTDPAVFERVNYMKELNSFKLLP